jgi:hypothetical protein
VSADNALSIAVYGWAKVRRAILKNFDNARPHKFSADGTAVHDHWVRRWKMTGIVLADPSENEFSGTLGVQTLVALLQAGRDWFWAYRVTAEIDHRILSKPFG